MTDTSPTVLYENAIPGGGKIRITENIFLFRLPAVSMSFNEHDNQWIAFSEISGERLPVVEYWLPDEVSEFTEEHFYGVLAGIEAAFATGIEQGQKLVQLTVKRFFEALTGKIDIEPFIDASEESGMRTDLKAGRDVGP